MNNLLLLKSTINNGILQEVDSGIEEYTVDSSIKYIYGKSDTIYAFYK